MRPLSTYLFESKEYTPMHANDYMTVVVPSGNRNASERTEIQERFTCDVFNNWRNNLDSLTVEDLPATFKDEKYLVSFKEQVKCMKIIFDSWDNPIAGYLEEADPIGRALSAIHSKIRSKIGRQKDTVDPSDIFVYEKSEMYKIKNILWEIAKSKNTGDELLKEIISAISELVSANIYTGVSLKMGSGFSPKWQNLEEDVVSFINPEIINIRTVANKTWTISINCIDPENENKPYKVSLEIRDRGNKIGVEAKTSSSARVGSCPDFVYKSALSKSFEIANPDIINFSSESQSIIQDTLDEFNEKIKNNELDSIKTKMFRTLCFFLNGGPDHLRQILLWCEKINSECVPHLLIEPKKQYV